MAHKIHGQQVADGQPGGQALSLDTLAVFLRVLQMHSQGGPPEVLAEVVQLKHQALLLHPELQVLIIEAAAASSVPTPAASFPTDIEEEANAYFQRVQNYSLNTLVPHPAARCRGEQLAIPKGGMSLQLYASEDHESVNSLISRLSEMKRSSSPREQEIFQCMIQSLFDEYRFFQKYPDKELQTTAALFGGLIHSNLIVDQSLGDALRLFLDALRNPAGHKMCKFGLQALHAIADQLPAWPQYCRNLLQVSYLSIVCHARADSAELLVA